MFLRVCLCLTVPLLSLCRYCTRQRQLPHSPQRSETACRRTRRPVLFPFILLFACLFFIGLFVCLLCVFVFHLVFTDCLIVFNAFDRFILIFVVFGLLDCSFKISVVLLFLVRFLFCLFVCFGLSSCLFAGLFCFVCLFVCLFV